MRKLIVKCLAILFLLTIINYLLPITYAQQATLVLNPATATFNRGCIYSIKIDLNTGGADSDGTDAIIRYDTGRFTITPPIVSGTIYPEYPGSSVDTPEPGKIVVSGLASVSQAFRGAGTLATINLVVKDNATTGLTQMTFEFNPADKSNTTDSNVVQRGTIADILNSVTNGNYTIGTGTCPAGQGQLTPGSSGQVSTPSASTPSVTPAPFFQPKVLPPAGSEQLTATIAIVGSILTVLGILGLALL